MKPVMQMKKVILFSLAVILILGGLFFWKGGHHGLMLADVMAQWLDADQADQAVTLQLHYPDARVDPDTGKLLSHEKTLSLHVDTFRTEYADRNLCGMTVQGMTVFTDGKNLYMDTGKAYALPQMPELKRTARRLALGMLLHGRITKTGDIYTLSMKTDELELNADITVDQGFHGLTLTALIPEKGTLTATMTTMPATAHPIPREVSDAIVQAKIEAPPSIMDPLEILLPALENLLPLQGDLTLGVECGILDLEETVQFRMDQEAAQIERRGTLVSIDLPDELSGADPALLGLLLLRNGSFLREGELTRFEINLSPEAATALLKSLVPQAAGLGIGMECSTLSLDIQSDRLSSASIRADGSVPFLITTIPVTFTLQLTVA